MLGIRRHVDDIASLDVQGLAALAEVHLNIACGFCTSLRCVRMVCEYFRITRSKQFGSVHLSSEGFERIQTIQAIPQNSGRHDRGCVEHPR